MVAEIACSTRSWTHDYPQSSIFSCKQVTSQGNLKEMEILRRENRLQHICLGRIKVYLLLLKYIEMSVF